MDLPQGETGSTAEIVLGKPLKMSALVEAILSLGIKN
jgi:hypothetical protein